MNTLDKNAIKNEYKKIDNVYRKLKKELEKTIGINNFWRNKKEIDNYWNNQCDNFCILESFEYMSYGYCDFRSIVLINNIKYIYLDIIDGNTSDHIEGLCFLKGNEHLIEQMRKNDKYLDNYSRNKEVYYRYYKNESLFTYENVFELHNMLTKLNVNAVSFIDNPYKSLILDVFDTTLEIKNELIKIL